MNEKTLPWAERVNAFQINPEAATPSDIRRMAEELAALASRPVPEAVGLPEDSFEGKHFYPPWDKMEVAIGGFSSLTGEHAADFNDLPHRMVQGCEAAGCTPVEIHPVGTRARLAALPSHPSPQAEAWQPMETAPRDGTEFLARLKWDGSGKITYAVLTYNDREDGHPYDCDGCELSNWVNVLEWHPIPSATTESKAGGEG